MQSSCSFIPVEKDTAGSGTGATPEEDERDVAGTGSEGASSGS